MHAPASPQHSCHVILGSSPHPVSDNAHALAFFAFVRSFAQSWGITISATILQNELKKKLPQEFVNLFPGGVEIAYAAIPVIPTLPEPIQTQVREAFADSLSVVWKVMIGFAAAGFVTLLLLKEVPMMSQTDETYGLKAPTEVAASIVESQHSSSEESRIPHAGASWSGVVP